MISSLSPFDKTVAGSTPIFSVQDFPGRVFKPSNPCEKEFYESLDKHPQLKRLVPKYFGTLNVKPSDCKINESNLKDSISEYLVLEDLTYGFTHPCILDVKLGTIHHDLDSPRRAPYTVRRSKYLTAPALGFCLTGMQVYKLHNSKYEFMDKSEGRELTERTVVSKLLYFFHNGIALREDVINLLLQRLRQVSMYFENQPAFTFRSTSLLLLYEGKPGADTSARVDVRMIDFAHAKVIRDSEDMEYKDEYGYLFGTRNLVKVLEELLPRPAQL